MSIDPIESYTQVLETHGVFALVIIFIFIVERRAIHDLKNAAASPQLLAFYMRNHRSAVVVRNVLLAPAILVWAYSLFFPPAPAKLITMRKLSRGTDQVEIAPTAKGVEFYKREYDGGQVDWDLRPKNRQTRWAFTVSHRPLVPAQAAPPVQLGETGAAEVHGPPLPLEPRDIELNVAADGPEEYEYRLETGGNPNQMGHLYAHEKDAWVKLPWEGEELPRKTTAQRPAPRFDWFPTVFAQSPLCSQNGMPKDPEQVLNDLGNRDLTVRIAARKTLVSAGASCGAFLEYAAKNAHSSLYRDRPLVVESLNEVLKQLKDVSVSPDARATLGKQNYDLGNYDQAMDSWKLLDDNFLSQHPNYLFYEGYAASRKSLYGDAVKSYQSFLSAAPAAGDTVVVRTTIGDAYYQFGQQMQKSGDRAAACQAYKSSITHYKQAVRIDPSQDGNSKSAGFWRRSAESRMGQLQCN